MDQKPADIPPSQHEVSRLTRIGAVWTSANSLILMGLKILSVAILARILAPADFGVVAACMAIVGISEMLSAQGLTSALAQLRVVEEAHVRSALSLAITFAILSWGVIWLAADGIAVLMNLPDLSTMLPIAALVFFPHVISQISTRLLQRQLKFKALAVTELVGFVSGNLIVSIGLSLAGYGAWALIFGMLAGAVLQAGGLLWTAPFRFSFGVDKDATTQIVRYGGGQLLAVFGNYGATKSDNLIVGAVLGPSALGFYSRAYGLMDSINSVCGVVINRVLLPAYARLQDSPSAARTAYLQVFGLAALLGLPASILSVLFADPVVRIFLGPAWSDAAPVLAILGAAMFLRLTYKVSGVLISGLGAVYRKAAIQWVYFLAVVAGVWLASSISLTWVAVAVVFALGLNMLLLTHLALRLVQGSWSDIGRAVAPSIRIGVLALLLLWPIAYALRDQNALLQILAGLLGSALLAILCWYYRDGALLGPSNLNAIRGLLSSINGRRSKTSHPSS